MNKKLLTWRRTEFMVMLDRALLVIQYTKRKKGFDIWERVRTRSKI
jgi:hypothetical protein